MAEDKELKALQTALGALQPLDTEEQQRALNWLADKLGVSVETQAGLGDGDDDGGSGGGTGPGDLNDIKAFVKEKRPADDVARATTLAYFLTHGENKATYKSTDLSAARIRAALQDFNVSRAASNAKGSGYLTSAGTRTYQITSHGEALVEAMPDAEAMKKVRAQRPKRRKRATGKRTARAKTAARKR